MPLKIVWKSLFWMDDRPGKKDCAIQGDCLKKETTAESQIHPVPDLCLWWGRIASWGMLSLPCVPFPPANLEFRGTAMCRSCFSALSYISTMSQSLGIDMAWSRQSMVNTKGREGVNTAHYAQWEVRQQGQLLACLWTWDVWASQRHRNQKAE